MAQLFQKAINTINEHIARIYDEGELQRGSTIRKFRIVQKEGNRSVARDVAHYNLDMIISVGYRVNSYMRHAVPHLGDPDANGVHQKGLRHGR